MQDHPKESDVQSQNGWPASPDKSAIGITNPTIHGVDFPNGIKGGDVATVFSYVARAFHETVEPLHDGWCWGYYFRDIEGSDDLSNHASGTAWDFNAPHHPMGKRGTFSDAQERAIGKILDFCDGVVRWGGNYSGRPDEMHFEIVGNAAAVAKVAAKIRGGATSPAPNKPVRPAPGPALAFPLPKGYYFGPSTGPNRSVSGKYKRVFKGHTDRWWLQQFAIQLSHRGWNVGKGKTYLHQWGNDGIYGPEYEKLIKAFQEDQGLRKDGLLGPDTWHAAYHNPVT